MNNYLRKIAFELKNKEEEIRNRTKSGKCIACGLDCDKFCNSHAIPHYMLKNLSKDGQVFILSPSNAQIDFDLVKERVGINEAYTFRSICRTCDDRLFAAYEKNTTKLKDLNHLIASEKQVVLNQIFLKCALRDLYMYQANPEIIKETLPLIREQQPDRIINPFFALKTAKQDIKDFEKLVQSALNPLADDEERYKILYYKKEHKKYPIAAQGIIAPRTDEDNTVINNAYDYSVDLKYLAICVFPLGEESITLIYCIKKDYDAFKTFKERVYKMKDVERNKYILALFLAHSEQVVLNESAHKMIKNNAYGRQLVASNLPNDEESIGDARLFYSKAPDISRYKELPKLI